MPKSKPLARWSGGRGVGLIAITYVYFLIFAQFAFLKRLGALGIEETHLKPVMAAMAVGGILMSLAAPRWSGIPAPGLRLRIALLGCAGAAFLSLLPLTLFTSMAVALLIGCSLGLLTVTLVTHLRLWLGEGNLLLKVGMGTGLGYLLCNVPVFFASAAGVQAMVAGGLCLAGLLCTREVAGRQWVEEVPTARVTSSWSFWRVLICFTALVWLDSAAFFIIQNSPSLKAGTWQGTAHLWVNASLHLTAALGSAWLLRRRGLAWVLPLAYIALAAACLLLLRVDGVVLASVFYPMGVSLYSVALVAYPSLLAPGSVEQRGRQAGWIYAVAGWAGSALGIGMGQHLGVVPPAFVVAAGLLFVVPGSLAFISRRRLEIAVTIAILLLSFGVDKLLDSRRVVQASDSAVERGRAVYVHEGCIHCHSQYVRPHTRDELMWGPVQTVAEVRRGAPPLIGNRRQGPDLSEVGSRRSALWLRAHFENPAEVSHASFMPSYSSLFQDRRGDDLVAYVQNLHANDQTSHAAHAREEEAWHLNPAERAGAIGGAQEGDDSSQGHQLFQDNCVTCHEANGSTRQRWAGSFRRVPPDLAKETLMHVNPASSSEEQVNQFAHIIKFGIAETDMPGHEYMSDRDISALSRWLMQQRHYPPTQPNRSTGESQ